MSEPTRDPIQDLENFGTGGIAVNPLDPAAVRHLGDQRRRRQNTMYGAIAAVAVAAAVIPTAILATSDNGGRQAPITHTPNPDPTPTLPEPTVTPFPADGVTVKTQDDLAKLVGTTPAFKAFIGTVLDKDGTSCPQPEIQVTKYDVAGYASGGVGGCGGYQALWVIRNGQWKEALGTQDEWLCGDLARFSVPDGFAGDCYGPKALFGPDEDDGLRLGMTADEVRAAGGSVVPMGSGSCDLIFPPGIEPMTDQTLGYLSPTPGRGVVALSAQKDQVTPRGIRIGATLDEVKRAYPEGRIGGHTEWVAPIDDHRSYRFDPVGDGTIVRISIFLDSQDCYE